MQQVFGHALAPLATSLRTGQHIVEIGGLLGECSNCLIDVAKALHVHFAQALDLVVHLLHACTDVVLDCLE